MYFLSSLLQLVLAFEVFVVNGAPAASTPEPHALIDRFPHIYPRGSGGVFPTGAAASGSGSVPSGLASATVLVQENGTAVKTGQMFKVFPIPTGSGGLGGSGNSTTKPTGTGVSQPSKSKAQH
ncbi:MAG: hypothetical protein Q9191_000706 [Dirinaria sp. TL-2023a]